MIIPSLYSELYSDEIFTSIYTNEEGEMTLSVLIGSEARLWKIDVVSLPPGYYADLYISKLLIKKDADKYQIKEIIKEIIKLNKKEDEKPTEDS